MIHMPNPWSAPEMLTLVAPMHSFGKLRFNVSPEEIKGASKHFHGPAFLSIPPLFERLINAMIKRYGKPIKRVQPPSFKPTPPIALPDFIRELLSVFPPSLPVVIYVFVVVIPTGLAKSFFFFPIH